MLFDVQYSLCKKNQSIVVSKENGNQHVLNNKSLCNVFQYHIDGGINKSSQGKRCDYIVEAEKAPRPYAYIIELKGSDLKVAIDQILNTINDYRSNLKGYTIFPRIVIHRTSTHDIHGYRYRELKKLYPETVVKDRKYDLDKV